MSDRQPRTEAGKRLLRSDFDTTGWGPNVVRQHVTDAILAIEDEAAATVSRNVLGLVQEANETREASRGPDLAHDALVKALRDPSSLDMLRALSDAATPGPWEFEGLTEDGWALIGATTEREAPERPYGYGEGVTWSRPDAAFIVATANYLRVALAVGLQAGATEPRCDDPDCSESDPRHEHGWGLAATPDVEPAALREGRIAFKRAELERVADLQEAALRRGSEPPVCDPPTTHRYDTTPDDPDRLICRRCGYERPVVLSRAASSDTEPRAEPWEKNAMDALPFPTTDASKWAAEFVRLHGGDEGLMLSWFANAIEHGRGPDLAQRLDEAHAFGYREGHRRASDVEPSPDTETSGPREGEAPE